MEGGVGGGLVLVTGGEPFPSPAKADWYGVHMELASLQDLATCPWCSPAFASAQLGSSLGAVWCCSGFLRAR